MARKLVVPLPNLLVPFVWHYPGEVVNPSVKLFFGGFFFLSWVWI